MRQSGRISLLALVAIVGVLVVLFIFLFGQESLDSVGSRFMTALAKGDVDALTKLTYRDNNMPEDQIRKQWDFAVNQAGKHYFFHWRVTASMQQDADDGSVSMQVMRNAAQPGAYEEGFQLPMKKQDGQWKVDVGAISRDMYPALPR